LNSIPQSLLVETARRAERYLSALEERCVVPEPEALKALQALDGPLPAEPSDPQAVLALLDEAGSPATVASAGGRYFGFVTGSTLPAALAANWLAGAWDQNGAMTVMSPVAARLEEVALRWLQELLGLPEGCGAGFVTGTTTGNFMGIVAARHALLKRLGWDVEAQGLFGAPPIQVVVGEEVHASLLKALALAGLGRERVLRVPVDGQGRMRAEALPPLTPATLLCLQAGNVNTGGFDPAAEIIPAAREAGAWVHVDGAFGLWAAAAPARRHLMEGFSQADSWATDCHKWLNTPYDCGLVLVREPAALRAANSVQAAYLIQDEDREPFHYTPEMSRRARGIEVWAALRSLGRSGLAELVEGCCRHAARFARGLDEAGYQVLNQVELNQVLVSFGEAEVTRRVIAAVQQEGVCWCGATVWQGQAAMRISVSSWATTEADVDRCLEAIIRTARAAN